MDLREMSTAVGARHPWERARAAFFIDALRRHGALDAPRVLDVGAGDGWLATQLAGSLRPEAMVVCWDIYYTDEQLAHLGKDAPSAILHTTALPPGQFELMLFLDVLEHVEEDLELLRDLTRERLAPGGLALVSVPSYPALFSAHDRALGHVRRYRRGEFLSLLERAGLSIIEGGGLFMSLLPPRAALMLREKLRGPGGLAERLLGPRWVHGEALTRAVMAGLELDSKLARAASAKKVWLPGLTTWALVRRAQ